MLDADGNEITDSTHIGNLNPFRYRSYYFDTETELYYLKSRCYDPKIGRFITIDDHTYLNPDTVNGVNLYAYCLNNPLMFVDYTGCSVTALLIGLGIAAIAGGVVGGIVGYNSGARGWELAKSITIGFGVGLSISGAVVSTLAVFTGAILGAGATLFGQVAVSQAFALGALAVDAFAFFIAPLFGIEAQGIEYEPISAPSMPNNQPQKHRFK